MVPNEVCVGTTVRLERVFATIRREEPGWSPIQDPVTPEILHHYSNGSQPRATPGPKLQYYSIQLKVCKPLALTRLRTIQ